MMRLITYGSNGKLTLVKVDEKNLPPYAILSHTWESDEDEEVIFEDLVRGTGMDKAGYQKLIFCAKQALQNNLQHFWVDTCCIKQSSDAELSEAVNSMFRWYAGSAKCFVYLSDVSTPVHNSHVESAQSEWEPNFRASRWFRRGWTLQELLAPTSVEFFTKEGRYLGSKRSLEQRIHEITGITKEALRGVCLGDFAIEERFSWARTRETRRPEDEAYCLLGIFGIHMPLIYGEGRENALLRLRSKIIKSLKRRQCEDVEGTSLTYGRCGDHVIPYIQLHIEDMDYTSFHNQQFWKHFLNTRGTLVQELPNCSTKCPGQSLPPIRDQADTLTSSLVSEQNQPSYADNLVTDNVSLQRGENDHVRSQKPISVSAAQPAVQSEYCKILSDMIVEGISYLEQSTSRSGQLTKSLPHPFDGLQNQPPAIPSNLFKLDVSNNHHNLGSVCLILYRLASFEKIR